MCPIQRVWVVAEPERGWHPLPCLQPHFTSCLHLHDLAAPLLLSCCRCWCQVIRPSLSKEQLKTFEDFTRDFGAL
jgi:hypothetical protein